MDIVLKIGEKIKLTASLKENETARKIYESLPLEGRGSTWGEEIYFAIPVQIPLEEDAREVLEAGELAYWPSMQVFCVFYGPTPASVGDEIRAAGPVSVFGMINEDLNPLKSISGAEKIVVEKR